MNTTANPNPAAINTFIMLTATVSDVTTGGSNVASAEYRIDNGSYVPMAASDGSFDSPTENVKATIAAFSSAGVYQICVRGTDSTGNTGPEDCIFLAVYDVNAGFVTGGGWINSPPGAYAADPMLSGRASFGFVSKYKKGMTVPTGETEFSFSVAGLNFHSEAYEWLVVSGPRGQYKGTGTVNGSSGYGFVLTAWDGEVSGGGGVDRFRIKIYNQNQGNAVVYDNQINTPDSADPTIALGGGSIVIHK